MDYNYEPSPSRVVGQRIEQPITFDASSELFRQGMYFNDEMNRMTQGKHIGIPKGVTHFKNHEEQNQYDLDCIAKNMARIALGN
jgi:hypothetical protein